MDKEIRMTELDMRNKDLWQRAFPFWVKSVNCILGMCDYMHEQSDAYRKELEEINTKRTPENRMSIMQIQGMVDQFENFYRKQMEEEFNKAVLPIKHNLIERYNLSKEIK